MIRTTRLSALLLLLVCMVFPARPGAHAQAFQPLLVIVGSKTGITDISLAVLRRAFQGEPAEHAGKRLIPFNLPGGTPERTRFDRAVLGLEPQDVGRFWINRRIRDEGAPPRTLTSAELAVKVVASLPGSITYVSPSMVTPNVRVLTVDGKSPTQAGYPFGL